ncbi:hypothetical protein SAV31267_011300 [Streptomyces avermitilis]|uniref:Uncharacterized protein n=1 Tax=Streptomyces avermitilis TaxID=33903 RepID=A0A4D4MJ05_STRAX|nr:hypothetical protein SAVMC3_87100 [Streptomyces avermitilis]GDY71645.1 hypothetical protein SAV31267_011300 [Streptomyces avermitilis]
MTADQIHDALVRHRANDAVDTPTEYADAELSLTTIEDELLHLQRVASYFTPPPVRNRDASAPHNSTSGART